ncbi:MAG: hypothetical protein ACE5IO_03775 [Thermoplasmata archaeon]
MSQGTTQSESVEGPVDLRVVCSIVGGLALFAPFIVAIDLHWGGVTIMALTWRYPPRVNPYFGYVEFMATLPWTVWRVVFVYQMVRYYRGRSSRNVTILLGALAEVLILVIYMMLILLSPPGMSYGAFLVVPTPLMLVAALVFMWITPFREPKTPFGDRAEPVRWWREKVDSDVRTPEEAPKEDDRGTMRSMLNCPACGHEKVQRDMYPGTFGVRARSVYSCGDCGSRWEG